jgi:phosphoribosylformylglycinamidine cyclo-ligase
MKKLTYKSSGVDIDKANIFKAKLKSVVAGKVKAFGSLFPFDKNKYKNPFLVSSADGVGTKLLIAQYVNKHDTVGIDLVAMNVNDILCMGAEPLFFVDYIACGKLKPNVLLEVVKGINNGCKQAGSPLVGGETAQMPGMYREDEYDLAGFTVGVVDKNRIIDGSKIKAGNVVIGLASNGIHSNGYSLVRRVFSKKEIKALSGELLKPTRIYVKPILSLLSTRLSRAKSRDCSLLIKGIAHITGGAFIDKAPKILPKGLCLEINKKSWLVPAIFKLIQKKGNISDFEMYRTFNMGVGMILIVEKTAARNIIRKLAGFKLKAWVIGKIIKSAKRIIMK